MAESVLCAGFHLYKNFERQGTKITGDIDMFVSESEPAYFTLELGHRLGRLPKLSELSLDVEFGSDGHLVSEHNPSCLRQSLTYAHYF